MAANLGIAAGPALLCETEEVEQPLALVEIALVPGGTECREVGADGLGEGQIILRPLLRPFVKPWRRGGCNCRKFRSRTTGSEG